MSKVLVSEENLTNIGRAIRYKNGTGETYKPSEMGDAIANIITEPELENLRVIPTDSSQNFQSQEYYGYDMVKVEAIPSEYIVPTGELEITESGSYDVTSYASANVNVASGGSVPERGFVVNEWDSNGYATNVSVINNDSIPAYYFSNFGQDTVFGKLKNIEILEGVKIINNYAFSSLTNLENATTPRSLEMINQSVFRNDSKLKSVEILSDVEMMIMGYAFYECSSLKSVIFPNIISVPYLGGSSAFMLTPIESGTGYIYVPDSLVDDFKSATNWSTYANQIKPISELPTE